MAAGGSTVIMEFRFIVNMLANVKPAGPSQSVSQPAASQPASQPAFEGATSKRDIRATRGGEKQGEN